MTISITSPTSTTSKIQQNGNDVLTVDSSNNVTVINNLSVSGTVSSTGDINFDSGTLYVDATNNRVGIGTSSPATSLDIISSLDPVMSIISSGSGPNTGLSIAKEQGSGDLGNWNAININGNDNVSYESRIQWVFDSIANGPVIGGKRTGSGETQLAFHTNSGETLYERMRIDSSGNVLVNSTSNTGLAAKLFVKGAYGIGTGYGTATSEYRVIYMNSGDGTLYFHNGSNYAYLTSAGAWTNASDERLKNNIVDIKYGLDAVLNTQPRSYKMNDLDGDFIGFVAQELQTVIPEVVSGDPEKQLGVDYGSLVAVAFKAIQEQQEQIKALEARIEALENPS